MSKHGLKANEQLSRRDFLQGGAAVAAVVFGGPSLVPSSVLGANAPSNRIHIGCIGMGNMGFIDLKGLMHQDDTVITAVCDVNKGSYGYKNASQFRGREPGRDVVNKHYAEKKRSGRYKGCDAYNDFRELLARKDIDAVSITTPDHWHAIPTIMAAQAGKDIYCQKPLSLTIAEGRAMADAVRRHGVVLQTGTQHRSKDVTRFAAELIRNGRIGKLKRVNTVLGRHSLRVPAETWEPTPIPAGFDYDMWLGPAPWVPHHKDRCFYTFRFGMDYSGGETTNTGAHKFDLIQWANGTELTGPVEVEDLDSEFPKTGLFTTVSKISFRMRYANGVELICKPTGGWRPGMVARFEGTEGWIDLCWKTLYTYPESLKRSVIGPDEIHLYRSSNHYRDFLDCVKTRRDPIASVEIGHRSASVCHLANIAMMLKRKLRWDPKKEQFIGDEQANRMLSKPMRNPWHL